MARKDYSKPQWTHYQTNIDSGIKIPESKLFLIRFMEREEDRGHVQSEGNEPREDRVLERESITGIVKPIVPDALINNSKPKEAMGESAGN